MSDDPLLTLSQIAESLPGSRGAAHPSLVTITRWIVAGAPSRSGERVRLRATRAGHRWLVRQSDLELFFQQLAGEIEAAPAETRTDAADRKAAEMAARELAASGC